MIIIKTKINKLINKQINKQTTIRKIKQVQGEDQKGTKQIANYTKKLNIQFQTIIIINK